MMYTRPHHQAIANILERFDADFLEKNSILFGGGTRIALELGEFRESVDIDFFCIGRASYRAARSSVTSQSFGALVRPGGELKRFQDREIRADRDAIRAMLEGPGHPIKLEIIHFDNDSLRPDDRQGLFPVPCVGRVGCFATKLTANADRYVNHNKDILDLCMMRREWGEIPQAAWDTAFDEYGEGVIMNGLRAALRKMCENQKEVFSHATESLQMASRLALEVIYDQAPAWLDELS